LQKTNSISDVFLNKTPSLAVIKKDYGNDFMIGYLTLWLMDQNSFAGGKMTDTQLEVSVRLIFQDFYHLTMGDLKLISQRLRKKTFIRVSGNEFYREIEEYFNERCEISTQINAVNIEGKKEESENNMIYDEYKKIAEAKNIDKYLGTKDESEQNHIAIVNYNRDKKELKKNKIKEIVQCGPGECNFKTSFGMTQCVICGLIK